MTNGETNRNAEPSPTASSSDTPASALPHGWPEDRGAEISCEQVQRLREAGADFVLLDCRRPEEREIATIEPSVFLPMQELAERTDELEELREQGRPIVVYCHHGRRSLTVTKHLRQAGFSHVRSMAGGIDEWSEVIDPDVPSYG